MGHSSLNLGDSTGRYMYYVTWVAPLVFGAVVLVVDEERGGVEGRLAETD